MRNKTRHLNDLQLCVHGRHERESLQLFDIVTVSQCVGRKVEVISLNKHSGFYCVQMRRDQCHFHTQILQSACDQ